MINMLHQKKKSLLTFFMCVYTLFTYAQNEPDTILIKIIPEITKKTYAAFKPYLLRNHNIDRIGKDTAGLEYFLVCGADTINRLYNSGGHIVRIGLWVEYGGRTKSIGYYNDGGVKTGEWKSYSQDSNYLVMKSIYTNGWIKKRTEYYNFKYSIVCDSIKNQTLNSCVMDVFGLNKNGNIYIDSSFGCCSKLVTEIKYFSTPDRRTTGPMFEEFSESNYFYCLIKTEIFDNQGKLIRTVINDKYRSK